MPHDANGKVVKVGDIVNIPCVVKSVTPAEDFCNCTLETKYAMKGNDSKNTITLCANQVTIADELSHQ